MIIKMHRRADRIIAGDYIKLYYQDTFCHYQVTSVNKVTVKLLNINNKLSNKLLLSCVAVEELPRNNMQKEVSFTAFPDDMIEVKVCDLTPFDNN